MSRFTCGITSAVNSKRQVYWEFCLCFSATIARQNDSRKETAAPSARRLRPCPDCNCSCFQSSLLYRHSSTFSFHASTARAALIPISRPFLFFRIPIIPRREFFRGAARSSENVSRSSRAALPLPRPEIRTLNHYLILPRCSRST